MVFEPLGKIKARADTQRRHDAVMFPQRLLHPGGMHVQDMPRAQDIGLKPFVDFVDEVVARRRCQPGVDALVQRRIARDIRPAVCVVKSTVQIVQRGDLGIRGATGGMKADEVLQPALCLEYLCQPDRIKRDDHRAPVRDKLHEALYRKRLERLAQRRARHAEGCTQRRLGHLCTIAQRPRHDPRPNACGQLLMQRPGRAARCPGRRVRHPRPP